MNVLDKNLDKFYYESPRIKYLFHLHSKIMRKEKHFVTYIYILFVS